MTSSTPLIGDIGNLGTYPRLDNVLKVFDRCAPGVRLDPRDAKLAFDALLASKEPVEIANRILRSVAAEPIYSHPASQDQNVLIARNDACAMSLALLTPEHVDQVRVASPTSDYLLGVIGSTPLDVRVFPLSAPNGLQVFDPDAALGTPMDLTLHPGESMGVAFDVDVVQLKPRARVVVLKVAANHPAPMVWTFNLETRRSLLATASTLGPTHAQLLAKMLGELHQQDDLPIPEVARVLLDLAESSHHFVRWSAIAALSKVDFGLARKRLMAMTRDAHPEVRACARQAIQLARSQAIL